jgi:precorrin-2 dehydrogenase/sirohydrochlorin ferrochelatase
LSVDLSSKKYFTICLDIEGKTAIVFGGGEVARRKAASLKDAGAKVIVVSPQLDPVLEYMSFQKEITWIQREYQDGDIDGKEIVVAATNNRSVNETIGRICKERGIICNVVDAPDEGSYIVPTILERGPFSIAIGTSGISPTLAASVRQELEMAYGEEYGMFLEVIAPLRDMVQQEFSSPQLRQKVYDRMVSSRALSLLRSGMHEQALKELREIIYNAKQEGSSGSLPIVNS